MVMIDWIVINNVALSMKCDLYAWFASIDLIDCGEYLHAFHPVKLQLARSVK